MNYLDMQNRIIEETRRTDWAGSIVQNAIQDAIRHYKDECFAEAQTTAQGFTIPAVNTVDLPVDFSTLVTLQMTDPNGHYLPLEPMTMEEVNTYNKQDPPLTGYPQGYSIYGDQIWLWPIPDRVYKITWFYHSNLAPPAVDIDVGFWMNEASRMIRCYAKGVLWSDVSLEPDKAKVEFDKAQEDFQRLVQRSEAEWFDSGIRPWF